MLKVKTLISFADVQADFYICCVYMTYDPCSCHPKQLYFYLEDLFQLQCNVD